MRPSRILVEESVIHERPFNGFTVTLAHPGAPHPGAPLFAHGPGNAFENRRGLCLVEEKTPVTAQQVRPVRMAAKAAAGHREVAPLKGHHG